MSAIHFRSDNLKHPIDTPVNPTACTECGGSDLAYDEGEVICRVCGTVIANASFTMEPEWRAFTQDERNNRERAGSPLSSSMHDKGLATVIGKANSRSSQSERDTANKLKKWQIRTRVHSSTDRNLIQALSELSRLCETLNIPSSIKEQSAHIYRQSLEKDLVRGRSISAIVAASLYASCRKSDLPRTLTQIADNSSVSKKDIARCFRLISRELSMKMPVPDATSKIIGIASKIGISEITQNVAKMILDEANYLKMTAGKDPMGMAAAALYIACNVTGEYKTQKSIAEAANVTEVTIRNRYKGLVKAMGGGGLEEIYGAITKAISEGKLEPPPPDDTTEKQ
jgi:transcription initiation factor TFIIB